MRALGLGPSIVVGHSMGAFVATALAVEVSELVAGLIMIDGGYVPDLPAGVNSKLRAGKRLINRANQWRNQSDEVGGQYRCHFP
jgi:pimeloyl-ACP methyl ester carboxylesterase